MALKQRRDKPEFLLRFEEMLASRPQTARMSREPLVSDQTVRRYLERVRERRREASPQPVNE